MPLKQHNSTVITVSRGVHSYLLGYPLLLPLTFRGQCNLLQYPLYSISMPLYNLKGLSLSAFSPGMYETKESYTYIWFTT